MYHVMTTCTFPGQKHLVKLSIELHMHLGPPPPNVIDSVGKKDGLSPGELHVYAVYIRLVEYISLYQRKKANDLGMSWPLEYIPYYLAEQLTHAPKQEAPGIHVDTIAS